jgi:hypothetical protein
LGGLVLGGRDYIGTYLHKYTLKQHFSAKKQNKMYANICTHDIGKSPDLAVTARHYAQCTQHCCLCFRPPLPLLASAWGQCSIHPSQTRIHMLIQHGLGAKNVALNSEWCKIRDSTCYMCVISIYPSICCFYLSIHICMQAFIYVCVCAYLLRLLDGS